MKSIPPSLVHGSLAPPRNETKAKQVLTGTAPVTSSADSSTDPDAPGITVTASSRHLRAVLATPDPGETGAGGGLVAYMERTDCRKPGEPSTPVTTKSPATGTYPAPGPTGMSSRERKAPPSALQSTLGGLGVDSSGPTLGSHPGAETDRLPGPGEHPPSVLPAFTVPFTPAKEQFARLDKLLMGEPAWLENGHGSFVKGTILAVTPPGGSLFGQIEVYLPEGSSTQESFPGRLKPTGFGGWLYTEKFAGATGKPTTRAEDAPRMLLRGTAEGEFAPTATGKGVLSIEGEALTSEHVGLHGFMEFRTALGSAVSVDASEAGEPVLRVRAGPELLYPYVMKYRLLLPPDTPLPESLPDSPAEALARELGDIPSAATPSSARTIARSSGLSHELQAEASPPKENPHDGPAMPAAPTVPLSPTSKSTTDKTSS